MPVAPDPQPVSIDTLVAMLGRAGVTVKFTTKRRRVA
jgi:hypothetical protein